MANEVFGRRILDKLRIRLEVVRRRIGERISGVHQLLAEKYNAHPHQVVRYEEVLGSIAEAERFLGSSENDVLRTIRTNTLKISREELMERLKSKGFTVSKYTRTPYGIIIKQEPMPLGALHEYLYGFYIIQGPGPMLPVVELDPRNTERVADMCAGAGVKTTQIAQHAPRSIIVATDINRRKLLALKNHASRMGISNIIAIHSDARKLASLGKFDKILLDAPCSGEGLWPFKRGRWKRSFDDIASRTKVQLELLLSAIGSAKPGASIVYSTCSISVEENELLISLIVEELGDHVTVEDATRIHDGFHGIEEYMGLKLGPETRKCKRFYPHHHHTEGFTICKLRVT